MSGSLIPNGKQQYLDANGAPLAGGKVYYYIPYTTTAKNTWQDINLTILNTNPIILDSAGECIAWGSGAYRQQIYDVNDNLIWDQYTYGISPAGSNFISQEEVQTATQGQTVFTLATIIYVPGINSLVVFVNGSKQVTGTNYTETAGNTVTFVTGLNAGDVVDFYASLPATAQNMSNALNVAYVPPFTASATTNVQAKLAQTVSVKDFGAVGDGVTDDTTAIQNAINTGSTVIFPKATYYCASTVTLPNSQTLLLNGSKLIIDKNNLLVTGTNVFIDLQGGTLSQNLRYATVATNCSPNGTTITVTDSSLLKIGQTLVSSYGDNISQFPLGGPTSPTPLTISQINGNVVTLSGPMTGTTVFIPQGLVIGNFAYGAFIEFSGTGTLTIQNGSIERAVGYYYYTPNIVAGAGEVYFNNINFNSNGLDQFLVKNSQTLRFSYCNIAQQFDMAKSGIWFDGNAYVYLDNCNANLGNFDQSFAIIGSFATLTDGELFISNSTINGSSYLPPGTAYDVSPVLEAITLDFPGTFGRIQISNTRFSNYQRWFITTTTNFTSHNCSVQSLKVDNCLIDGSFAYLIATGSGNAINISSASISNTSFYQSMAGYQFFQVGGISGATGNCFPQFDNCYFKLNGGGLSSEFFSSAIVRNSQFSSTALNYYLDILQLSGCTFDSTCTLSISPGYDVSFYGSVGDITINNSNFPTNPNAVFSAEGGSSLSSAVLANAKSINGSTYYKVYKLGTNIQVSGTFYKVNGSYFLRGDDYFIPIGSLIQDLYQATIEKVTFNLATTLTASAAAGATSIAVTSATGIATGDKLNVLCDNGLVSTVTVGTYTSGLTIPISALGYAAASGNKVNFFRLV